MADRQDDRIRQDAAHREAVQEMQQKLKGADVRVSNIEHELELAQARQRTLEEEKQQLQHRITESQTQLSSPGETQVHLEETRTELQAKAKALETARNTAELEALKITNQELETAIKGLRLKVEELEHMREDLLPAKEAVEERIRQEVDHVRTESLRHSEEYRAQLDMETRNQLKKLTSDRDRFEKQITPLKAELAAAKKNAELLQTKIVDVAALKEQLDQSEKTADVQATEIDELKSSLNEKRKTAESDVLLKDQVTSLSNDLDDARVKLQKVSEENTALHKQNDGYLQDSREASEACEQATTVLAIYRADAEAQFKKLNEQLETAQEAQRRAEAGQEHLEKSCDAAIEKEVANRRRQVESLQKRLAQADADLAKEKKNAEDFRAETEEQWRFETANHTKKLDELRTQVQQATVAKNEALAESDRAIEGRKPLIEQVDMLQHRLQSAEDKLKQQQEPIAKTTNSSSRLTVPSLSEGLIPSASVKSTEPARTRKKVDRHSDSTLDTSALPIDEFTRPVSRESILSQGDLAADKPCIEDSQAWGTEDNSSNIKEDGGLRDFQMFSNRNDMSKLSQTLHSQPETQIVEETQADSLPSFATFNRNLSATQIQTPSHLSSTLSQTYEKVPETIDHVSTLLVQGDHGTSVALNDAHDATRRLGPVSSTNDSQDDVENQPPVASFNFSINYAPEVLDCWSQEERDKYTFRKKTPQPNSASKLVRNDSQSSASNKGHIASLQERAPSRERRLETPELRSESAQSSQSSSPAYVQPTALIPKRTYSNMPMTHPVKREPWKTQDTSSQDPRLIGRNPDPVPKRKAENHIVEGYEQERKKRLSSAATQEKPRFNL